MQNAITLKLPLASLVCQGKVKIFAIDNVNMPMMGQLAICAHKAKPTASMTRKLKQSLSAFIPNDISEIFDPQQLKKMCGQVLGVIQYEAIVAEDETWHRDWCPNDLELISSNFKVGRLLIRVTSSCLLEEPAAPGILYESHGLWQWHGERDQAISSIFDSSPVGALALRNGHQELDVYDVDFVEATRVTVKEVAEEPKEEPEAPSIWDVGDIHIRKITFKDDRIIVKYSFVDGFGHLQESITNAPTGEMRPGFIAACERVPAIAQRFLCLGDCINDRDVYLKAVALKGDECLSVHLELAICHPMLVTPVMTQLSIWQTEYVPLDNQPSQMNQEEIDLFQDLRQKAQAFCQGDRVQVYQANLFKPDIPKVPMQPVGTVKAEDGWNESYKIVS